MLPLRGRDAGMAERELDLLEGRVAFMGELGIGPPQVMRGQLGDADNAGGLAQSQPNGMTVAEPLSADVAAAVDWAERGAGLGAGGQGLRIDAGLAPARHRHATDAAMLADQVNDYPARLALLDMLDG